MNRKNMTLKDIITCVIAEASSCFSKPFQLGNRYYITDRRIFISFDSVPESHTELSGYSVKSSSGVSTLTDCLELKYKPIDFASLKGLDLELTKKHLTELCQECKGTGEVVFSNDYSTYNCVCRSCKGGGEIKSNQTYIAPKYHNDGVMVESALLQNFYLVLVQNLPGVQIMDGGWGKDYHNNIVYFKWDGGFAGIMPMLQEGFENVESRKVE